MIKVFSWNINGIRASGKGDVKGLMEEFGCDLLCLQETKLTRDQLEEKTAILDGFNSYYSCSRVKGGYSGVATICRDSFTPVAAEEGLTGLYYSSNDDVMGVFKNTNGFSRQELQALDSEGRSILTKHRIKKKDGTEEFVTFINVYCPNASFENEDRLDYKIQFYRLLQERAESLIATGSNVIILGDINTIHKSIDSSRTCEPQEFAASKGRQWLNSFLVDVTKINLLTNLDYKFIDTFRYFHPTQTDAFTAWSTKTGARATNFGSRIDYIFSNVKLVRTAFDSSDIQSQVEGSDHCPVTAALCCEPIASSKCPSFCTKYWQEFAGKQQKLFSFFQKVQKPPTPEKLNPIKRSLTSNSKSIKKLKSSDNQKMLSAFFKKNSAADTCTDKLVTATESSNGITEAIVELPKKTKCAAIAAEWKNVFKGPQPAPLCGHNEPAVLRTVRKPGVNFGRQFYVCTRGEGQTNNPEARCNFFKWKNQK